jgi:site-specific DNA recombinase
VLPRASLRRAWRHSAPRAGPSYALPGQPANGVKIARRSGVKVRRRLTPGARGRPWSDTTIRGHHLRRTGLLRNDPYVSRLVWNKQRYVKDPRTGKRLARINPESAWVVQDVAELRIIEQEVWAKVQARLMGLRDAPAVKKALDKQFWLKRRPKHLLTGVVRCGSCGGPIAPAGKDYLACSAARRQGTCGNRRSLRRGTLETLVIDALRQSLMAPDLVAEFVREFRAEINRCRHEVELGVSLKRREIDEVSRKLNGLIDAIAEGLRTVGLKEKLESLEARKAEIERELAAAPAVAPRLHPNLAEVYRKKVANLAAALADRTTHSEALEILRGLVERVTVTPIEDGAFEIELVGEIARMVTLGTNDIAAREGAALLSSVEVVAGARNQRGSWGRLKVMI